MLMVSKQHHDADWYHSLSESSEFSKAYWFSSSFFPFSTCQESYLLSHRCSLTELLTGNKRPAQKSLCWEE